MIRCQMSAVKKEAWLRFIRLYGWLEVKYVVSIG